jgi:hypothetical protein
MIGSRRQRGLFQSAAIAFACRSAIAVSCKSVLTADRPLGRAVLIAAGAAFIAAGAAVLSVRNGPTKEYRECAVLMWDRKHPAQVRQHYAAQAARKCEKDRLSGANPSCDPDRIISECGKMAQENGQTPAKAIENLRLEGARAPMEDTNHTIDVVAQQSGFGDRDRMRRAFLRAYGQSPHVIRRQSRGYASIKKGELAEA